ncbi:MAG: response regulator [Acidimicrobiales bacterium]
MIRVLIIDDQAMLRDGLRLILESAPDISVVGEASSGEGVIALYERTRPDVALVDIRMPRVDGVQTTVLLSPLVPVIILTTFGERENLIESLRAGAVGFLLKDASAAQLLDSVRAVAAGGSAFTPTAARDLIEIWKLEVPSRGPIAPELDMLTDKERQVLFRVAEGLSNAEIAEVLYVSEATVKTHVSRCLEKIGLRDRTQLALFAVRNRLID